MTIIPVDRWRAAMRASWMLGLSVLIFLLSRAIANGIHWNEMWAADRFTLVAEVALLALFVLLGFALLLSGGRWFLLAIWTKPTQVEIGGDGIALRLGPFGVHVLDWSRMQIVAVPPRDEEFPLPDDDDPQLPQLHHAALAGDAIEWITRFTGATPGELMQALEKTPVSKGSLARDLLNNSSQQGPTPCV